jgi:transporter family protein
MITGILIMGYQRYRHHRLLNETLRVWQDETGELWPAAKESLLKAWLLYSVLTIVVWGLGAFFPKIALGWLDPKTAFIFEVLGGALTGLFAFLILRPQLVGAEIRGIIPALLTGVTYSVGVLTFMYAIRQGKVSIVAPLTAIYPVVTLVLAMIFLKERVNLVQLAGIILAIVSVVLISYE